MGGFPDGAGRHAGARPEPGSGVVSGNPPEGRARRSGEAGSGGGFGARRAAVVDALCEHFARDAITLEDFERRVDRAHGARSRAELEEVLADLPGGAEAVSGPGDDVEDPDGPERPPARVPAERLEKRSTVISVMGGNARKGRWIPSRQINCVAFWGGVELDFREALMGPGTTEVNVFAVMGGVEILVPPGLYVESAGLAVMGGFENREDHPMDPEPDAPILKVRGFALMGAVKVSSRYPGESRRDAKIRRRERRRARRLEGR